VKHIARMTNQRRIIIEELSKVRSHPTAMEVFELARKRLPRISLGTVYRNLEVLAETGIIQKLETAGSQMRFDGTVDDHYHIRCISCGRVEDVDSPISEKLANKRTRIQGYNVLWHKVEFVGVCPECQKEKQ
jgi:Fur family ferric uptake transcriptional regulator